MATTSEQPGAESSSDADVSRVVTRVRRSREASRSMWSRLVPIVVSGVVHAGILGAAGLVAWELTGGPVSKPAPPPVVISFDRPAPAQAKPSSTVDARPAPSEDVPPSVAPPQPVVERPVLTSAAGTSRPREARGATSGGEAASRPVLDLLGGAGRDADVPGGAAAVAEEAGRAGVPEPVNFAGMGASTARGVVYVVDASGPMVTSMQVVLRELERSVGALSASQKFNVVLFRAIDGAENGGTLVFAPTLMRATPQMKTRLSEWLREVGPRGRSAPLKGLEVAIAQQPDAVFLLSRGIDRTTGGVWDLGLEATLARLEQLNPAGPDGRRPVVIKTIQFLEDDPTGVMRAIGRAHGSARAAGVTGAASAGDDGYRVVKSESELQR